MKNTDLMIDVSALIGISNIIDFKEIHSTNMVGIYKVDVLNESKDIVEYRLGHSNDRKKIGTYKFMVYRDPSNLGSITVKMISIVVKKPDDTSIANVLNTMPSAIKLIHNSERYTVTADFSGMSDEEKDIIFSLDDSLYNEDFTFGYEKICWHS